MLTTHTIHVDATARGRFRPGWWCLIFEDMNLLEALGPFEALHDCELVAAVFLGERERQEAA